MIGWGAEEDDLGDQPLIGTCCFVAAGEECGNSEGLTLLEGRVLCEEHREEVLRRRADRRERPWA